MKVLQNLWEVLNPMGRNKKEIRSKLGQRPQLASGQFAATYFTEDKRAVAKRLMEITESYCGVPIAGLSPEDEFVSDLKIGTRDGLEFVEFILEIEEEFKIEIAESRVGVLRSFAELVDEIVSLQKRENLNPAPTEGRG